MVCQSCGSPVQGPFCSRCGAQVQAAPAPYAVSPQAPPPGYIAPPAVYPEQRVQRHIHTLGIMWCVYGAYRALAGVLGAMFLLGVSNGFVGRWGNPHLFPFGGGAPWMAGMASTIAVLILISSALAFAAGFSLLTRKPWGRTLAIVAAILSLIKIPFGTALGIYTLWALAPAASGFEYDAIADRS